MKALILAVALAPLAFGAPLHTHDDHDHSHPAHKHSHEGKATREAGPNGGRLITKVTPHLEFLVTPERMIELRFVDEAGAVVPPDGQEVSAVGGSRANPLQLTFTRQGDNLVSNQALPEGDNLPIILSIRMAPDAEVVRERFHVNLTQCPTCNYAEYACICAHNE